MRLRNDLELQHQHTCHSIPRWPLCWARQDGFSPPDSHDNSTYLDSAIIRADSGENSQVIVMEEGRIGSHVEAKERGHTGNAGVAHERWQSCKDLLAKTIQCDAHPLILSYPQQSQRETRKDTEHKPIPLLQPDVCVLTG